MVVSSTIFREGIYKILEFDRDIEITAETSTSLEIIPLLKQKKPDVLLIDTVTCPLIIGP
jgi:DNA-binding NarL/FixJ family response regulator